MLLVGFNRPSRKTILHQLTSDSIKYWEDSCSGNGIAFLKEGKKFIEYQKGRYSYPEIHRTNKVFVVRKGYVELYNNSELSDRFRMLFVKDSLAGLYDERSKVLLTVTQNQETSITKEPMLRKGYVHSSIQEASYRQFSILLDSLFTVYNVNRNDIAHLLDSSKIVLKVDSDGNVIQCGFLKNHIMKSKDLSSLESEILKLCYQIICIPAKDTISNETFESNLGIDIIKNLNGQ